MAHGQTFWLFQTYLHDLSANPQSGAFKTCRRLYNKLQHIVFGAYDRSRREKLSENILPVSVLASFVLASIAVPFLPHYAGPLAVAQARKPRSTSDTISDASQTVKLSRSQTVVSPTRPRKDRSAQVRRTTGGRTSRSVQARPAPSRSATSISSSVTPTEMLSLARTRSPNHLKLQALAPHHSTTSLPDMESLRVASEPATPATGLLQRPVDSRKRPPSPSPRPLTPSSIPPCQKISLLRSNYFRSETQLLTALEDISNRLVVVPKPARLSALRAELALIAQDLPAEVDVPVICPATLPDGTAGKSMHHRIVRLNPAEATVLNSAERVPYLLMVEVLREDFDFNPDTEKNEQLIAKLISEKGTHHRRIFDLTDASRHSFIPDQIEDGADSVFEPATGDLGSSALITSHDEDDGTLRICGNSRRSSVMSPPWQSRGTDIVSTKTSLSSPRTSDMSNGNAMGLGISSTMFPTTNRIQATEQPDVSALATHMRTAARMLTQLDSSEGKRPKDEVAAIKARIISSMQTLEEQSFNADERQETPTFATILATSDPLPSASDADDLDVESISVPNLKAGAGAARMENDQKTGGVERKGDREDPSAATFGEKWSAKKERIRRSSPYGAMENWDLLSVIVKTGADLRQEAFACQLIQVCWKIWQDAGVPVWVKRMRILVTGESSGLIETITNGVSLHSIKRSLTLATIAAGKNPRNKIATLKDHFIKSFGEPTSEPYKAAERAFIRSLAAYSIICYVLQLKDRHNGNILIDEHGSMSVLSPVRHECV